jgi:tRNA A37 threonylcarbamoyladenosine dehydratase
MDDYHYRFSGIARLYGQVALERFRAAHIAIIGVGGVGSWAVEALVRSGIGTLTLIDLDDVCLSNVNRQLPALTSTIGKSKVSVLAERARSINPEIVIHEHLRFFTEATANELLNNSYDAIIDAIDTVKHKALLVHACHTRNIPLIIAGGAGGKRNPADIRRADLLRVSNDPLLRKLKQTLRRDYGFNPGQPFGIECVYSIENPVFPGSDGCVYTEKQATGDGLRLNCDTGFGSATQVTGAFGFSAAAAAIDLILRKK